MILRMFLFLMALGSVFAKDIKDFPLWGSNWLVTKGHNDRIFHPTMDMGDPQLVFSIEFKNYSTNPNALLVRYRFSNLMHKDYNSTYEALSQVNKDFRNRNDFFVRYIDKPIPNNTVSIEYNNYSDTLWTCDHTFLKHQYGYKSLLRDSHLGLEDKFHQYYTQNPVQSLTKPICYGKRDKTYKDKAFKICIAGQCFKENPSQTEEPTDYCEETGGYCYDYFKDYKYTVKNLGYWQVHIYPEVVYYCRDPETGKPITDKVDPLCKMTESKAFEMKDLALTEKGRNQPELRKYRNPFFSDSASSVISFAFIDSPNLKNQKFIWLDARSAGASISYSHIPYKMVKYSHSPTYFPGLAEAVFSTYASNADKEQKLKNFIKYCRGWEVKEPRAGDALYIQDPKIPTRLIKKDQTDPSIFIYNGCPSTRDMNYNLTPSQMKRLLIQNPPTCNTREMKKAFSFYKYNMDNIALNDADRKIAANRLNHVQQLISAKINGKYDPNLEERLCPQSWVKVLR